MNECVDCVRLDCAERGCIAPTYKHDYNDNPYIRFSMKESLVRLTIDSVEHAKDSVERQLNTAKEEYNQAMTKSKLVSNPENVRNAWIAIADNAQLLINSLEYRYGEMVTITQTFRKALER
jgi:hypothetical protein